MRHIAIFAAIIIALAGVSTAHAEPERQTTVHTVAWGENLYRISLRYNVTMDAIMAANDLTNPDRITVGQELVIPQGTVQETQPENTSPVPTSDVVWHTVQRGEVLSRISQQYGVPMSFIVQENNLANPSLIYAGQRLKIVTYGEATADQPPAPKAEPTPRPPSTSTDGKLIVVDLSDQRTYAYQNGDLLRTFVVSTGLPQTPTVVGDFAIYLKYESQWMSGPGYSLPGVPWVMYFYRGYGFHGTYWHSNFGQPMSHGCVNMVTEEARWLWNFAPIGTPVTVQY
jgi:LysM repeat protein